MPLDITNLSPAVQRNLKLESIFMPEARRQREKAYENNQDNAPRFVHYTPAEAALKIISKKRIWLRNATNMVDYREVQHGFDLLRKYFADETRRARFFAAFDAIVPGVAMKAFAFFDGWWTNTELGIQTGTYLASFSEHNGVKEVKEDLHGRLSMWRAFGAVPACVALVFRPPPFSGAMDFLKCFFSPVAYLNEAGAHAIVDEVVANAVQERHLLSSLTEDEMFAWLFHTLVAGVTCLKHEGFHEEKEWRLIYLPGQRRSTHIAEELITRAGVPQIIYNFPIDGSVADELADIDAATMFDRLIIGPTAQPFVMRDAFAKVLTDIRVVDAQKRIIVSGIPLRAL